ncbi:MAG: nucleotidyltransferase family protein [Candidatus Binatus sp.]|uniref:nucleotidyltransferase family protein n=1 Tax=Candidatus Binatus sp. TaxID=2811406 RepID=UPI00271E8481|nr:nucleotidyltransferase family protein [Candidatus Binatus sp.]MDO8432940.1 nucleotidyltransferase family protein [Candidatus Binatus sp.]
MIRVEGIILAAGESRRMGYPKPLLKIDGVTFIEKISASMLEVVPRLVIVLGAHAERIRPAIPRDERIAIVENPNYSRGQLSSLKVGLAAIGAQAAAAMVQLGDHPLVRADSFRRLADAYEKSGVPIAIARHAGRRGHPLIFARALFAELLDAPEDEGARYVVNRDPARVMYVDLDDPGINLDLDTPADLKRAGLAPPPRSK